MSEEAAMQLIAGIGMPKKPMIAADDLSSIFGDSLDMIWGIQEIEKLAGAPLPNAEIAECVTVGDLARCIAKNA